MNGDAQPGLKAEDLRKRNVPTQVRSEDEARNAVLELNAQEERTTKDEKDRKTFGRTPDGTGRTSGIIAVHTLDRLGLRRPHQPRHKSPRGLCFLDVVADHEMQFLPCHSLTTWCHSYCPHQNPKTCQIC